MALIFILLYAPIVTLVVLSFNASKTRAKWGGFTLHWYRSLFANTEIMNALYTTLIIALLASAIATILGTLACIGINSMSKKSRTLFMGITNIPMLNGEIVMGISLMLLFIICRIQLGFGTILMAHITFNVPYVILSVMPKLKQTNKSTYEAALDLGDARIKDADDLLLLVDLIVLVTVELQNQARELAVPAGHVALGRTGDDQRGTSLIDKNGVDLIDDGVVVATLYEIGLLPRHVVAQVIKTEFVVGAVGDVGVVLLATLRRLLVGDDAAGAHAEEAVDTAHQLGLVAGQIVVDGDDVDALTVECVQVGRQRGHKGLAFTGLHFGDVAPVQSGAAHELHVEVTLAEGALGDLAHGGERLGHDLVQTLAVFDFLLELRGLGLQVLVGEGGNLVLQGVHGLSHVLQLLELVAFTHSQGFVNNIDHWVLP